MLLNFVELIYIKGKQDTDHVTLVDHLTIIIEYVVIGQYNNYFGRKLYKFLI